LSGIKEKPETVYAAKKKTGFWRYMMENITSAVSEEIGRNAAQTRGAQYRFP
jgi:hypothetical protein